MRLLVCGGRDIRNETAVWSALYAFHACRNVAVLINGTAQGADSYARSWAIENGVDVLDFPADWSVGRSAGPVRNKKMLEDGRPDFVLAFPGGSGTENMVSIARRAGIEVLELGKARWPNASP